MLDQAYANLGSSSQAAPKSRSQAPIAHGFPEVEYGPKGSGGSAFPPSSPLTSGIKQRSGTWLFPPNRQMLTFWLISSMLLKTLEAKGRRAYKAEEDSFFTFWPCLAQKCHVTGNTCCRFCSPGPISQLAQLVLAPSTWAVSGKGMKTDSAPPPHPNCLLSSSNPLLVIMWIEAVIELRKLPKAEREHTGKGQSLRQQLALCTPLWNKDARSCA